MKVDFYRHELGPEHAAAVADVIASPFLTTGGVCKKVEGQIAGYFDVPCALLVNSWTNGALALLLAMDLAPGDEIIIPSMTFIATANVVELAGGKPIFVDADPATLLVTPDTIGSAVNARTRAVMPVHLYGQMCDIAGIRQMLDSHPQAVGHIPIIEDCAHCFEGMRDGLRPGQIADAAVFSFYATKNVTCGEGGAIILRDEAWYRRTLESRLHGMTAIAVDRFAGGRYNHWDMARLGTKANLPDLLACLLPSQIETIDDRLPQRRAVADRYRAAFAGGPLRLVESLQNCVSAEHIFPIGIPAGQRDAAIAALNGAGVSVTVNYRSVPGTRFYKDRYPGVDESCAVALRWGLDTLTLPLYPGLLQAEQDHVIETVRQLVYPLVERA
jgi:UDP-4-amino-4-deoxy-L-arabinose-oxoglutarate aminotransferase